MKKLIFTILKIVIALILSVLLMGGIYYVVTVVYYKPPYVSFCIMALLVGLVIMSYFIVHYLRRLRQKKFVENIVAQDDLLLQKTKNEEYVRLTELRERWLSAINTIKGSSLAKRGNPLYVLPWYMIIGETDSGKSSSISHCGLSSISSEVGPVPGVASTRNCDWWFFDKAIVIDTAGKYTVPLDGKIDEAEWKEFLIQVATYRKKEPINGILITLPMDKLLLEGNDEIDKYANFVSERVNRIVRVLSAKIPVYVMITKTDKLAGFEAFEKTLSNDERDQAFGYTSLVSENHLTVVDRTIEFVTESLRKLVLVEDGSTSENSTVISDKAGILLLSENLKLLKDKIKRFIQVGFDNTIYHEEVLLRGIYFTSALQTGEISSLFADSYVEKVANDTISSNRRSYGYFLKNLFSEIMPKGRGLFQPIADFLRWKTITSNLALISVAILTLGSMGYISYCAQYSETRAEELGKAIELVSKNKFINEARISSLVNLMQVIDNIEDDFFFNYQFKFTKQTITSSLKAAKHYLVHEYEEYNMHELLSIPYWDKRINSDYDPKLDKLESDVPHRQAEAIGDAIMFFSIMDSYYQERLNNDDEDKKTKIFENLKYLNAENLMCKHFNYDNCINLFKRYIKYRDTFDKNVYLLEDVHSNLDGLLYKYKDFSWVERWANEKAPEVRAGSFLPMTFYPNKSYDFSGAFSIKGYKYIGALLDILPTKHSKMDLPLKKQVYMDYYASNFKNNWINFLYNIQKTSDDAPISERVSIIPVLTDPKHNPFFVVYDRAYKELSFISQFSPIDTNLMLVEQLSVANFSVKEKSSEISKLAAKAGITDDKISKIADPSKITGPIQEQMEDVAKLLEDYFKGIDTLMSFFSSNNDVYKGIQNSLTTTSDSNVLTALQKVMNGINRYLTPKTDDIRNSKEKVIISGSIPFTDTIHFLQHLSMDMTACAIQERWLNRVVTKVNDENVDLFGEKGIVSDFINKELSTLITEGIGGYESVDIYGMKVPFTPQFINFLNERKSIVQTANIKNVSVKMSTTPMEVNDEALLLPQSSLVTIHCKDNDYKLSNFNYENDMSFEWKKDECTSASLDISFEGFDLHTDYEGPYGLADFFQLFLYSETHDFTAFDFPGKENMFDATNLQWIRLSYKIKGGEDVVRSINASRTVRGVPQDSTYCK